MLIYDRCAAAGTQPGGAGFNHRQGSAQVADAPRGFDAHPLADHGAHQADIFYGRSTSCEAGGGFDEIASLFQGDLADQALLSVCQVAGFEDHFADHTVRLADLHHGSDLAAHERLIAGLQGTHVDDHVDLTCAARDCILRLEKLDRGGVLPKRKADGGADAHRAALQELDAVLDLCRVNGDHGEAVRRWPRRSV